MTPEIQCDLSRLQGLLSDSLPDAAAEEVSAHVADCPACRQELEALAAGKDWWDEAGRRLSQGAAEHTHDWSDDESLHFATDFAVDFLEPSEDPTALGRLGEYEISEVIGRGGMGIVLKGFQKELHRHVAVKVLSPHLASSGAARKRFAREAQATAAVVHPHVMAIHSVNATAKLPYLVMPYVACESLQQRLNRHGPLDVKDVLRIGLQAAHGLAAAHAQGIVHRDVKPANILLETNVDRVLLTDFGLARAVDDATLTRTGIIAGTPQFMSPEQANGDAVDHRSDLFSLGGVLYALCTGRPPFRAETTFGVLRRIRETSPRPIREINADIPDWLERIVLKLLEKQAADRFATALEVATLLEQCLAHVQQPTTVPLPESVGDWPVLPPAQPIPQRSLTPPSRWRFRTPFLVAFALMLPLITIPWWFSAKSPRSSSEVELLTNTSESSIPLDWDASQIELDSATDEIQQLESTMHDDLSRLEEARRASEGR